MAMLKELIMRYTPAALALALLAYAYRTLPATEASRIERARAAGEPI